MFSTKRSKAKNTQRESLATDWSEWAWDEPNYRWYRHRLDSAGRDKYDFRAPESPSLTNDVASAVQPQTLTADGESDQSEDVESSAWVDRGRSEQVQVPLYLPQAIIIHPKRQIDQEREFSRDYSPPDPAPRDPSVSPSRPVGPGPDKPPPYVPKPAPKPSNEKDKFFENPNIYLQSPEETTASHTFQSAEAGYVPGEEALGGVTNADEYSQDLHKEPLRITIKERKVKAAECTSRESFVSYEFAKELKIKPRPGQAWYFDASGNNNIECKERITARIGFGRLREEERFYIVPKGYHLETRVVLGIDLMSKLQPTINATDFISTRSEDSGYGSGHSPRQSYQIPIRSMDNALSTTGTSTTSYTSPSSFASSSTNFAGSQASVLGGTQDTAQILYSRERVGSQGSAEYYRGQSYQSSGASEANFNPADTSQEYQSSLSDNYSANPHFDANATSIEEAGTSDYVPSSGTGHGCNSDEQYTPRSEAPV